MSTETDTTVPATSAVIKSGRHYGEGFRHGWDEQMAVGFTASALAASNSDAEDQENFAVIQKQVSDAATATVVGFKDSLATSYQIEGRGLLEAAKNANAASVQATNNFNLIQVEAVKNAAAAQLEAQKNASSIAAQLAECCCELKERIREDGEKTRDLIGSNEMDRLRAQLVATQRLIPVTVPVGA